MFIGFNQTIYEPNEELEKKGEVDLFHILEEIGEKHKNIDKIIHVAEKEKEYNPGYDIEVRMHNGLKIGYEVKSTKDKFIMRIYLTNNELNSAMKNCRKYNLVILVYNKNDELEINIE